MTGDITPNLPGKLVCNLSWSIRQSVVQPEEEKWMRWAGDFMALV